MTKNRLMKDWRRGIALLLIFTLILFYMPHDTTIAATDPVPSGNLYVNGVDLLQSDVLAYPDGVSYSYNSVENLSTITLSSANITLGSGDSGVFAGIFGSDIGDVEILLIGENTITVPNDPESPDAKHGIYIGSGSLAMKGDGTLDIFSSKDSSIRLDARGNDGKSLSFDGNVTVGMDNSIFTEGNSDGTRPNVYVNGSAKVTSGGIECGNDNVPFVSTETGASYTDNQPAGEPGDPGEPKAEVRVNGLDLLDPMNTVDGVTYTYNEETSTIEITLNGVTIENAYDEMGNYAGIMVLDITNVNIILTGENTITIPDQTEPVMVEGKGIFIGRGNLTISGSGSLEVVSGGRSIQMDAYGEPDRKLIFEETVQVNVNHQIMTEGGADGTRPNVYVNGSAKVTSGGIECGNDNVPFVSTETGASYTDNQPAGEPGDEPLNLYMGNIQLVKDGLKQEVNIPNLSFRYSESKNQYELYLLNGEFEGIHATGVGNVAIYTRGDCTVKKLDAPYENYSIVLEHGGEIDADGYVYNPDEEFVDYGNSRLRLSGGIFAGNMVSFKDNVSVVIGSAEQRVPYGIDGGEGSVSMNASNEGIKVWASDVGVKNVNVKADNQAYLDIDSSGKGAEGSHFQIGEGSCIAMSYSERGDFTSNIYNWDYFDMSGPVESYANMSETVVEDLVQGNSTEDKYIYSESLDSYRLESTANRLYALGYNYDNDKDGIVDNPEEEIKNGQLSIKGATGVCWLSSDGFMDYHFEAGTEVTVELLPDYGYQYKAGSLKANGQVIDTTPKETRAFYTFIMPEGNVHISAAFENSEDTILNNSNNVDQASVSVGENSIHGNVEFVVSTDQPTPDEQLSFAEQAGNKTIGAYLDLRLEEVIKKAGTDGVWTTPITELSAPVQVSLSLASNLRGNSDYRVVRIHDGIATVLETTYFNGVVTFSTDQFSSYAVVYNKVPTTPAPSISTPEASAVPVISGDEKVTGWDAVVDSIAVQLEDQENKKEETIQIEIDMKGSKTIPKELLEEIKGEPIEMSITMDNGIVWVIKGEDVENVMKQDIDLTVSKNTNNIPSEVIKTLLEAEEQNVVTSQISLSHNGQFGFRAKMNIDLTSQIQNLPNGHSSKPLVGYLYYYNPKSKKLELQSVGKVGTDGKANFTFEHASDYVILVKDELTISDEIWNQITVNKKAPKKTSIKTIFLGGNPNKFRLKVEYPQVIQDGIDSGLLQVKSKYVVANSAVATVSQKGLITAYKRGRTYVVTTMKIGDKTLRFRTAVKVKKPTVTFITESEGLKKGKQAEYEIVLYGFKAKDVVWSSSKRDIAVVGKNAGKLKVKVTGKSKGTDNIIVKVKDQNGKTVTYKKKIVIK